ncbi:MAG: polysaccharide biosynthesis tyrosine autokinase, partial [Planctomycetes bacterium]|nr:polysaccharide biosynthesis tyrosine autokinase [Planctomycetota bacterium]
NIAHQQIGQYAAQVAELKLELSQLEQFRDVFSDPERIPVTAEDRALVEADPQVAELARTVFLMEQQRASDESTFGAAHRERRQLDAQIRVTEERLAQLRAEKYGELRESRREATNTAYANTQHALFLAQENMARAEAMLVDQDQLLFAYQNIENEILQDVELQQQLNERIRSLNRVVRQQAAVDINITQRATDPLEQHSPSLFVLPIGLFLALAFSVGIALALELLNKSIRTSQDISRYLRIPVLGAVPHTDDEEVAIKRVETAFHDTPQSMVAEAFRRIRTNLRFSAPVERQRSIIVTSPLPEDGKTTVACNLALAIAQEGQRVLLVDANFRRPAIHNCFEVSGQHGLSEVLIGKEKLEACVTHTDMSTLDVLGSGPTPAPAAELLGGAEFQRFLEQATSQFEQVIIDTPPVLLASDALVMAPYVGGVVLVVRANENTRGTARRASNLLADVKAHLFGAVLNAAQVTRGGYFREQLRAYYDYQPEAGAARSQAQPPPAKPS